MTYRLEICCSIQLSYRHNDKLSISIKSAISMDSNYDLPRCQGYGGLKTDYEIRLLYPAACPPKLAKPEGVDKRRMGSTGTIIEK